MTSVRFSKVVENCGRPEVYLLMSETDQEFHKALNAGKIMSLSDESHGAGTGFGTVGYDRNRRGQLLLFPKSLKTFSKFRIIGIKYNLFAGDRENDEEGKSPVRKKELKKAEALKRKPSAKPLPKKTSKAKKTDSESTAKRVIPFPSKKEKAGDEVNEAEELKGYVRQAMRALEKGNSVAAYNILKRVVRKPL
jgi:hypothetical protein